MTVIESNVGQYCLWMLCNYPIRFCPRERYIVSHGLTIKNKEGVLDQKNIQSKKNSTVSVPKQHLHITSLVSTSINSTNSPAISQLKKGPDSCPNLELYVISVPKDIVKGNNIVVTASRNLLRNHRGTRPWDARGRSPPFAFKVAHGWAPWPSKLLGESIRRLSPTATVEEVNPRNRQRRIGQNHNN